MIVRGSEVRQGRHNVAQRDRSCEKIGWRRPLRSARLAIAPENAHLIKGVRQPKPVTQDFFTASQPWGMALLLETTRGDIKYFLGVYAALAGLSSTGYAPTHGFRRGPDHVGPYGPHQTRMRDGIYE